MRKYYEGLVRIFCTFLRRGGAPPLRECAKLAWLEKLYTTILYSTGGKVVVNTTVGQLGAVRRLSNNFRGGGSKGRLWLVKVKLLKLCRTSWRATTAKPSGVSRSPPGFASPLRELSPKD